MSGTRGFEGGGSLRPEEAIVVRGAGLRRGEREEARNDSATTPALRNQSGGIDVPSGGPPGGEERDRRGR